MDKILEYEGIKLCRTMGQYFLQYDAGELMIKMKSLMITEGEANQIIQRPDAAYKTIISYQDRGIYGEDLVHLTRDIG